MDRHHDDGHQPSRQPEQPRIACNEPLNPALDEGCHAPLHVHVAGERDRERAECIHNQVPHGVSQAGWVSQKRLLHVHARQFVHRELEDFPQSTDRECKAEREKRDQARPHVQVQPRRFVKKVDQQESEYAQKRPGSRVQREVPPPEPTVEVPCFAEEERSKQPSVFSVLRALIQEFGTEKDNRLGLVGAFGYDLLFQFDPIELKLPRAGPIQRVIYGHTHRARHDYLSADQAGAVKMYVNTGTFLPLIERARDRRSFVNSIQMTMVYVYRADEDTERKAPNTTSLDIWNGIRRKQYI